jgi:4-amino-4-deoxy-L-arabinose transferase-like glycosyltransferase
MELIGFALAHFGMLLLLALSSYVLGRRLTRALPYASAMEAIVFSTGLGLGSIAYLVFLLGVLGWLYTPILVAALILLQLLCYPVWRDLLRQGLTLAQTRSWQVKLGASSLLLILVLAPLWLRPLYPPTAFDTILYHLAYAKIYVQQHQLVLTPYLRFPVGPQTNEMLFTLSLLLTDDILAQLVALLMTGLVALAVYAWGRRVFSARVGLGAAALWLGNPLVEWLGVSAYVDVGLTLFVSLAAYAFFNWVTSRAASWLALAGVFAGLAAGSKYSALFFLGGFGLAALMIGLYRRRWTYPLVYGATALAVAAPWYIRNAYYTGNPVSPFLPNVFGYRLWNAADMQGQLADWAIRGLGKTLPTLLLLPWNLVVHVGQFGNDPPLLPVYYLALPLVLLFAVKRPYLRGLLLLILPYTLFWFFSAQILRYLLPIIPALGLAEMAVLGAVLAWLPFPRQRLAQALITGVVCAASLAPGWLYAWSQVQVKGPVPVTLAQRDAYLADRLPSYKAHKFLNTLRGADYRLYGLYDENMAYYTDGVFMGDAFGPARRSDILDSLDSGQHLYAALTHLGADYFLVTAQRHPVPLPDDAFFHQHFQLVYNDAGATLFQLTP